MLYSDGACVCPLGTYFNGVQCATILERATNSTRPKFSRRQLQSTQTTQITDSVTYTGQTFTSTDSSFSQSPMLQVAAAGLTVNFVNCTFDIAGQFLSSSYPVALNFTNCLVKLANTTSFLSLDYSGSCSGGHEGDLYIANTVFSDGSLLGQSGLNRSLITMKSLFDVTLQSVTFTKMTLKHSISIHDYQCSSQLRQQAISFNGITVTQSNVALTMALNGASPVSVNLQQGAFSSI